MPLEAIRERKRAVEGVQDVVGAMRATAAGRIQGAQRAMAAARRYREVVVRGLSASGVASSMSIVETLPAKTLLIVVMSEQPLCGGFNHAILDHAVAEHEKLNRERTPEVIAVGQRGARVMARRGLIPNQVEVGATSLTGLRDLTRRLAKHVDRGYVSGAFSAVDLVYARYRSVSEQVPTTVRILPIDPALLKPPDDGRFFRYLPDPELLAGLVGQYAFISLYHAAAESYASEQASRLVAMDGATRNTARMVEELTGLERRERQQEITRQVLEQAAARINSFGG